MIERRVNMKKIGIEMSNDLHKSIRIRAIELDKTVKGYILDLIKNDLEKKTSNSPLKLL
jgi:hypothetical protein